MTRILSIGRISTPKRTALQAERCLWKQLFFPYIRNPKFGYFQYVLSSWSHVVKQLTKITYSCFGSWFGENEPLDLRNPKASTIDEVVVALNKQHSDVTFFVMKQKNGTETLSYEKNVNGTASSIENLRRHQNEKKIIDGRIYNAD